MKNFLAVMMGLLFLSATGISIANEVDHKDHERKDRDSFHEHGGKNDDRDHDKGDCFKTPTMTTTATQTATAAQIATATMTATDTATKTATGTMTFTSTVRATTTPLPVQGQVNLNSAARFVILAATTITNSGLTTLCGDLGLSPGSSVTGAPVMSCGGIMHITDPAAAQAELDATTAFNFMAGLPGGTLIAGNLGGLTLSPGLYKSTSTLEISSGDLTLDAKGNPNAVFIFQIASSLTTTPGRQVVLAGGAQAANIFWQVGSLCSLDTTTAFKGTIIAGTQITMNTGAVLVGRAFALTAQVTMLSNSITKP